ncbi:9691_t:CDS:2 [Ambispora gerdemannii]|uniref:L-2-hydroxyglutarate dehydrogenase, mitochondrial n=1 Tax=Ambispora gerdemannii TaxID=144530 RepID=A0A9N8VD76_9GLOM|nr:9691_t:CDS:2 [Ambispora gerdemannii]
MYTFSGHLLPFISNPRQNARYFSTLLKKLPEFSVDYLVIGGGVVGLAIANRLSCRNHRKTLLVEKNASSRNSEIIHAGIYYSGDSLKTRLCIRGKELLYSLLSSSSSHIPYRRVGKWIVSEDESQTEYLHTLKKNADLLGVETYFLAKHEQERQEPDVRADEVLVSPTTGIFDSHAYMRWLETKIREQDGDLALHSQVVGIEKDYNEYKVEIATSTDQISSPLTTSIIISARIVINAAGLHADKIAEMILPTPSIYKIYYVKGHYYGYRGRDINVNRLIYPVPPKNLVNLGTHLTLDLAGKIRFGPDVQYVDSPYDYDIVDEDDSKENKSPSVKEQLYRSINSYLPKIREDALYADYTGIRPKLQAPGESFRDFIIQEETKYGLEGFINLIGIESPGLTSSLAIGEMVADEILADR